jgi:hypothetical protein
MLYIIYYKNTLNIPTKITEIILSIKLQINISRQKNERYTLI